MRRTSLILLIVLVVVAFGGGAWWWMNRETIAFPWQTKTVNVPSENTNMVTNTPNVNTVIINAPTEVKGDTTASGSFIVSGVTVKISSLQLYDTFTDMKAEKGKKILAIYTDQVATTDVPKVSAGLLDQGSLTVDGKSIAMGQYKIAGTQIGKDRGWLTFQVPEGTTSATLVIGTGATATSIPLTIKK